MSARSEADGPPIPPEDGAGSQGSEPRSGLGPKGLTQPLHNLDNLQVLQVSPTNAEQTFPATPHSQQTYPLQAPTTPNTSPPHSTFAVLIERIPFIQANCFSPEFFSHRTHTLTWRHMNQCGPFRRTRSDCKPPLQPANRADCDSVLSHPTSTPS